MAFLPGIWLFFSLSYSRGNHHEFSQRWKLALAGLFLVPLVLGIFFNEGPDLSGKPARNWHNLDLFGFVLSLLLLRQPGAGADESGTDFSRGRRADALAD